MNQRIDDASINSSLFQAEDLSGQHYYQKTASLRKQIKAQLREKLTLEHDHLYLLNNSTHCLLNILYGLHAKSIDLAIAAGCYLPYQHIGSKKHKKKHALLTHVDPNSGRVIELKEPMYALDAAQSIGTIAHHRQAIKADLLFFPLHKHLALQAGVGVLCINRLHSYEGIIHIAQLSESGTINLSCYEQLLSTLQARADFFNIALFDLNRSHLTQLQTLGLTSLTPLGSKTPFIVVRSNHDLDHRLHSRHGVFSFKKLSDQCYRISCYINGKISSAPVDCTSRLFEYLQGRL